MKLVVPKMPREVYVEGYGRRLKQPKSLLYPYLGEKKWGSKKKGGEQQQQKRERKAKKKIFLKK